MKDGNINVNKGMLLLQQGRSILCGVDAILYDANDVPVASNAGDIESCTTHLVIKYLNCVDHVDREEFIVKTIVLE